MVLIDAGSTNSTIKIIGRTYENDSCKKKALISTNLFLRMVMISHPHQWVLQKAPSAFTCAASFER
jgi:hypothetical protein